MAKRPPLHSAGQKVGDWTLIEHREPEERNGQRLNARWLCRCVCGKTKEVGRVNLENGRSKSCGHNTSANHSLWLKRAFN